MINILISCHLILIHAPSLISEYIINKKQSVWKVQKTVAQYKLVLALVSTQAEKFHMILEIYFLNRSVEMIIFFEPGLVGNK